MWKVQLCRMIVSFPKNTNKNKTINVGIALFLSFLSNEENEIQLGAMRKLKEIKNLGQLEKLKDKN